jgi:hypothetical protein
MLRNSCLIISEPRDWLYISLSTVSQISISISILQDIQLTLVKDLGNAFNQFVNPIALAAMQWRYYAVYIALDFLVAFIAYLHFPETRRLSIEEISLVFDYGTKEGRERALHDLETARNAEARQGLDQDGEKEGGKQDFEHLEQQRSKV